MTAIVISWIVAIVPSFYFYVYGKSCKINEAKSSISSEDCKFLYAGDFYHFVFTTTPVCLFITWVRYILPFPKYC